MAKEIERKFLVAGDYKQTAVSSSHIVQGYIGRTPSLTFRIRLRDERGYLTVKGRTDEAGMSRDEWEYEIPAADARELLAHSDGSIEKRRYMVPAGRHTFEVDEFFGANEGLTMAEVELSSPDETFERPAWLGDEVTGDKRYYNSQLLQHPYSTWKK